MRKICIIGSIIARYIQVSVVRKLTHYCRTRALLDADGARLQAYLSIYACVINNSHKKAFIAIVHQFLVDYNTSVWAAAEFAVKTWHETFMT